VASESTLSALSPVLWRVRACLSWARDASVQVVHVHTLNAGGAWSPPIPGFEPLYTEAVIAKRAPAAFKEREWARSVAAQGRRFYLVGLSLGSDILATALAGAEQETRIVLVRDALSMSPRECSKHDDAIDQVCRVFAPRISTVNSSALAKRYRGAEYRF